MNRSDSFVPENDLKLVILGQGAVGKSSVTTRFVHGDFNEDYNPTLQEIFRKTISVNDKVVTLGTLHPFPLNFSFSHFLKTREIILSRNIGYSWSRRI